MKAVHPATCVSKKVFLAATAALFAVFIVAVGALPASAEPMQDIAAELQSDGVFVAPSRNDIDEDEIAQVVQEYAFEDLDIGVVAPANPEPTPEAFARRVQEKTNKDGVIIFLDDGTIETHVAAAYEESELRATQKAKLAASPKEAVERFANELPKDGQTQVPGFAVLLVFIAAFAIASLLYIGSLQERLKKSATKSKS